jgi:septum formation protein
LLRRVGFRFTVQPSNLEERFSARYSPRENARRIALEKALAVAGKIRNGIVIGADTIVVLKGKILGKPRSQSEARSMLRSLSGHQHTVFTGFALVDAATRKYVVESEKTLVRFRPIAESEIEEYVASGSPMDKAGAYGIQDDYGALFVERVEGCFYNVVGFPLTRFYVVLQQFLKETNHHHR